MIKQEALRYLAEKSDEGWMVHEFLLSIYDDNEDIPEDVIDLICHQPTPSRQPVFIVGERLQQAIDIAATRFLLVEAQKAHPLS